MREMEGYVPIEPDGSVRVAVPANIAFQVDVVDADPASGRVWRVFPLHAAWLQLLPGEEIDCNGCHVPAGSAAAPGRRELLFARQLDAVYLGVGRRPIGGSISRHDHWAWDHDAAGAVQRRDHGRGPGRLQMRRGADRGGDTQRERRLHRPLVRRRRRQRAASPTPTTILHWPECRSRRRCSARSTAATAATTAASCSTIPARRR